MACNNTMCSDEAQGNARAMIGRGGRTTPHDMTRHTMTQHNMILAAELARPSRPAKALGPSSETPGLQTYAKDQTWSAEFVAHRRHDGPQTARTGGTSPAPKRR